MAETQRISVDSARTRPLGLVLFEQKGNVVRWLTHGRWGYVVSSGLPLAAVLLIIYGWAAALILTVFTIVSAALYALFIDRPREQRDR
ncbi:hypothetical protein [Rhodococcus sp. 077-4]|uniref:hypothetical protein n=1 Tax=Rhodococcus sp. 077-4 TaxID=2789271 RepID=UPI0039F463B5